jgi:replication initiation and membrane attachment protein DnaB
VSANHLAAVCLSVGILNPLSARLCGQIMLKIDNLSKREILRDVVSKRITLLNDVSPAEILWTRRKLKALNLLKTLKHPQTFTVYI